MADTKRLQRVVFASPVLDPNGNGAQTSSTYGADQYDLALDAAGGVEIRSIRTGRTVHADVPCSYEAFPVPAEVVAAEPAKPVAKLRGRRGE